MKFKDVAHLYLGCEILEIGTGLMGKLVTITVDGKGVIYFNKNRSVWKSLSGKKCNIKPILRPLSDITADEDKECSNIMFEEFADKVKHSNIIHYEAHKIAYLLSKHFDLFGLHDNNECLYKNENNEYY